MLVSRFLIDWLERAGIRHVMGVPGDYILDFYSELWDYENIEVINNTDENHSGFAADAYARINGIGCVVVTYNVGASKVINAVQCAYAERSPLVIISGAPGMNERNEDFLLHHMVGNFNSQKAIFENITCASIVLDDPATAEYEIKRAFEALHRYKRPIYIELPRDVAKQSIIEGACRPIPVAPACKTENLYAALNDVTSWIEESKQPVIIAGVELGRYGLEEELMRFAERTGIPVATTLLSKSVFNERHPLFAGIYSGNSSNEITRQLIEESDCLLMFGVMLTDMTLCFRPAKFSKRQVVHSTVEGLQVKNHNYADVQFSDFCSSLFKMEFVKKTLPVLPVVKEKEAFEAKDILVTTQRVFEAVESILDENMAVIADVGDSLFGAAGLTIHNRNHFLSPAFYTTMGFAVPGALGVQTASPDIRPIVVVGDGSFQMSATELSTIVHRGLNPIVIVLNNDGYTTERFLLDGDFNNIHRWNYHNITLLIGGGEGRLVKTEIELFDSLREALDSKILYVLNIEVERSDISEGLRRITRALAKKV
ncbi:alpha-keto acid decarboxylase family protein [Psychromonas ossibalaenae]|uniref:alpha-keto acid decarboxylase family protein n=1 Tax=Psychromonas ossibalaenae TaxID=444922 RepID=UPI000361C7F3|nr:thiamine pyrophosphate-binding protein [Psychromonas ossibalaenae]